MGTRVTFNWVNVNRYIGRHQNITLTLAAKNPDSPFVFADFLNRNLYIPVTDEALKFLSPLDEQNAVVGNQIVKAEGFELAWRIHAVEVNVIEASLRAAIFVDESKCRAGDVFLRGSAKGFGNAFDQSSFACAEVAAQQDKFGRREICRKFTPKGDGFFW